MKTKIAIVIAIVWALVSFMFRNYVKNSAAEDGGIAYALVEAYREKVDNLNTVYGLQKLALIIYIVVLVIIAIIKI